MKIVLAGAYGNLGSDILRSLLREGHEVVAADMMERDLGLTGRFSFRKIDVTDPAHLHCRPYQDLRHAGQLSDRLSGQREPAAGSAGSRREKVHLYLRAQSG